jgi:hypothetical protein
LDGEATGVGNAGDTFGSAGDSFWAFSTAGTLGDELTGREEVSSDCGSIETVIFNNFSPRLTKPKNTTKITTG